ncbi:hypothetical protein CspHIS471_0107320 [Cutaneotrichosporon sp. HIS471]|nr:hypothetical protein CspHIS471_0107320 [Cutaneotrichosporon sp. HIS471]
MAARRSRRSSGLGSLGIMDQEDPLAEFDSFRRRHARQNREIITENITRKGLIRSLQDQVSSLQADLLCKLAVRYAVSKAKEEEEAGKSPEPERLSTTPKASPRRRSPRKSKSPKASTTPTKSPCTPASSQHTPTQSSPLTPVPDTRAIAPVTMSSPPSRPSAPSPSPGASIPSCSTTSIPWSSTSGVSDVLPASTAATSPQTSNQPATQPDTDPPSLASSSSSTASAAASTSTSDAAIPAAPEDGRSRRARSSVSYKEPSLRTKMRKPDGVSSEEALGLRPRGSMLEGVRRKSALPRSTAKMDFRADKEEEAAPTPLAPAKVVKETSPKEGSKKAAGKRRAAAAATTNAAGPAV